MRVEGVQYTCTRCGKQEFIPWTIYSADYDESHWVRIDSDTHLCPECGEEYRKVMDKLLHRNVN